MNDNNRNYVKQPQNFAKSGVLQLTLREVQSVVVNPRFWLGFAAVVLILAISGPFDTQNLLKFPERTFYWFFIGLTTFFIGICGANFASAALEKIGFTGQGNRLVSSIIAGIPIALWVWGSNVVLFQFDMGGIPQFATLMLYCVGITAAVMMLYGIIAEANASPDEAALNGASARTPAAGRDHPFIVRLPVELGSDIISLNAQDHYIQVVTTKGSEMILMRLADAEKELSDFDGVRIHRSWWVARKHITKQRREGGKVSLIMSNDSEVPVSRSYKDQI